VLDVGHELRSYTQVSTVRSLRGEHERVHFQTPSDICPTVTVSKETPEGEGSGLLASYCTRQPPAEAWIHPTTLTPPPAWNEETTRCNSTDLVFDLQLTGPLHLVSGTRKCHHSLPALGDGDIPVVAAQSHTR
jgi:hypothetical protein